MGKAIKLYEILRETAETPHPKVSWKVMTRVGHTLRIPPK